MARDFRRQLQAAQNFVASGFASFDLPRDSVYKEIVLRLEYQQSTPGAMTPSSVVFDRSPFTLIKRLDLIADGKDVIKSYDGGTLLDINHWDYGAYPHVGDLTSAAGGNTGLLNMVLIIDLESQGMQDPQNTWLDSRKLSSLELRVTFGAGIADLYGTVGNSAIDTYRLTPYGHEILDIAKESTFSVNQEVLQAFTVPATAATARQFRLNVGNAYRRIFISSVDQNSRAAVDWLTRVALVQNGTFVRRNWDWGALKQHNTLTHNMATGLGVADAPLASPSVTSVQRPGGVRAGLGIMDIAEDGSLAALLDTRGFTDISLEMDWTGATATDLLRYCPTIILPAIR